MDSRFKTLLLIALIVGAAGYFYSRDHKKNLSEDTVAEVSVTESLPKPAEPVRAPAAKTEATSTEVADKSAAEASSEFTVSEEERQRIYGEVKNSLASIYTAQKAFYAETGRYSTDLKAIGWDPLDGEMNVKVGFVEPSSDSDLIQDENPQTRMDSDYLTSLKFDPLSGDRVVYEYSKFAKELSLKAFSQHCRRGCSATSDRFEVMAVSKTGPHGEPEVWIIDDGKNITKVTE